MDARLEGSVWIQDSQERAVGGAPDPQGFPGGKLAAFTWTTDDGRDDNLVWEPIFYSRDLSFTAFGVVERIGEPSQLSWSEDSTRQVVRERARIWKSRNEWAVFMAHTVAECDSQHVEWMIEEIAADPARSHAGAGAMGARVGRYRTAAGARLSQPVLHLNAHRFLASQLVRSEYRYSRRARNSRAAVRTRALCVRFRGDPVERPGPLWPTLACGVYLYPFRAREETCSGKLILVR